jgi:hypothetical protein
MAVSLVSCASDKGAATSAITAAETAWTPARDNVMKLLPTEAKAMDDAIAAAKADLEKGDAKAALAAAKDLPAKIQELTASLPAKETELKGLWDSLNGALPGVVSDLQKKVGVLSKAKHLPEGLDKTAFDEVKTSLTSATQMWTEAKTAQQSGNLGEAIAKATGVKDLLVKALTALKMPVPAGLQS